MKFVVCFVGLFALAYAADVDLDAAAVQKLQEYAAKCQQKTSATGDDMAKLMKHEVPETKSAKCFMACMKKELGFMNADNSMNADLIKKKMNDHIKDEDIKEKGMKIVDMCLKEVKVNPDECEMAAEMMTCCVKHSKEMGITELSFMGN